MIRFGGLGVESAQQNKNVKFFLMKIGVLLFYDGYMTVNTQLGIFFTIDGYFDGYKRFIALL